jgi:RNA polymerase sigma-70 factor (ECF subfamily)
VMTSDEDLVVRALASNDRKAYGELVRRHQGRVRAWLRQLTGDNARADDLAQDTFIRAWQKLTSYAGKGKFGSWLLKIAYNRFIEERRGASRTNRLADAVENEQQAVASPVTDTAGSESPDLLKMLAILTGEERMAMVLCHAYGYSHSEASEITGMPLGTLKSHIKRGTEKIRTRFQIGVDEHD